MTTTATTNQPIVRMTQPITKPMTADEARLQIDLFGVEALLFTNADTGATAVMHRRSDGRVVLIEGT